MGATSWMAPTFAVSSSLVHLRPRSCRMSKPSTFRTEVLAAPDLRACAVGLLHEHLDRRPESNPIVSLGQQVRDDLPWLRSEDPEAFHECAFGTLRQLGALAPCASRFASWFDPEYETKAADQFSMISELAKSTQFLLVVRLSVARSFWSQQGLPPIWLTSRRPGCRSRRGASSCGAAGRGVLRRATAAGCVCC